MYFSAFSAPRVAAPHLQLFTNNGLFIFLAATRGRERLGGGYAVPSLRSFVPYMTNCTNTPRLTDLLSYRAVTPPEQECSRRCARKLLPTGYRTGIVPGKWTCRKCSLCALAR